MALLDREQLLARVRENLSSTGDLVAQLFSGRREAAREESMAGDLDEADHVA